MFIIAIFSFLLGQGQRYSRKEYDELSFVDTNQGNALHLTWLLSAVFRPRFFPLSFLTISSSFLFFFSSTLSASTEHGIENLSRQSFKRSFASRLNEHPSTALSLHVILPWFANPHTYIALL